MRKIFTRLLCGSFLVAILASCGEGDLGGGIGEFSTVNATASAGTLRLESDIIEGNDCSDGEPPGTFATDSVDFTITSTPQFTTGNALDLVVTRAIVHYDRLNSNYPVLPDKEFTLGVAVPPGSAVTVPVTILSDLTKIQMVTDPALAPNLKPCTLDYYEYEVTVTFEVSEPGGSTDSQSIPAYMRLAVADRT